MFEAFRLNGAIGRDMSMDLDDTLTTKQALRALGHFQTPPYGLTEYPDNALIDGLKSFQRANGLHVDGIMRPDGPTHRKLTLALTQPHSEPVAHSKQATYERPPAPMRRRPPLTLKQPVKASASVDLDDALMVKTAITGLGLLRGPKDGPLPYPDRALFDAIEAFQRQHGLRVDGEMAPDGPTVRKINEALQPTADVDADSAARRRPADGQKQVAQVAIPPGAIPVVPGARGAVGPGGLPPSYRYRGPDVEWTEAWSRLPDEVQKRILELSAFPLATKTFLEGLTAGGDERPPSTQPSPTARTQIADPLPPVPPSEPPDDEDELPDRTELPSANPLPSPEGRSAVDDELLDMIGGYLDQSDDELMQGSILESRGGPRTQAINWLAARYTPKRLPKYGLDLEALGCTMTQVGGSWTPRPESDRVKERWYKAGENRRGARTDITWKIECPGQEDIYVDLQTVTTYADGMTPMPNEIDADRRVTAWRREKEERGFVLNVPKAPGTSYKEWVRTHLEPAIEEMAKRLKRMIENNEMY